MPSNRPGSILVVRLSAMGDVIHALPAVATLKHNFPQARIAWAIEPRWAVLVRGNPFVDEVIEIDRRRWRALPATLRRLRASRFDLAIDFQGLLKSALVARASGAARIAGFESELLRERAAGFFYTRRAGSRAAHVVDRNLDLVAALGAVERRIEFPLPQHAAEGDLPPGDFVLASPFAGWRAKEWPPESYAQLATLLFERHGLPLVINCAPAEREAAAAIVSHAPRGACVLNVTSVAGLVGVTRRARAVVGVDSGPLHVAAALGKPGVALFGPTDPARNGPYGSTIAVLRASGAATTYSRDDVISASMAAIRPEQVFEALETQLSRIQLLESHR